MIYPHKEHEAGGALGGVLGGALGSLEGLRWGGSGALEVPPLFQNCVASPSQSKSLPWWLY